MMESRAISGYTRLAAFLSVMITSSSSLEISVVPPNPQVGDTVLFNVMGITEQILFSEWYQGEGILAKDQIIRFNNGVNTINKGDKFFEAADIHSNGSLVIRNVTKEMAGSYTVHIQVLSGTVQKTVSLAVNHPQTPGSGLGNGLSAGEIAGICTAILVVIAVVIGGIFLYKTKDSG